MHLFTSELFSSTMLQETPSFPRSYREPRFAQRYGRRRADRATPPQPAPLHLQAPMPVVRIDAAPKRAVRSRSDYGRAA